MGTSERLRCIREHMKERCRNPNNKDYAYYGGRGIKVCEAWESSFAAFEAWALSSGYDEQFTIDRIDSTGDYAPDNCRWVTAKEQARNRSSNWLITAWGETKLLVEWVEDPRCVVSYRTLHDRLTHKVFDVVETMMVTPPKVHSLVTAWGEAQSVSAWVRDPRCVVKKGTLLRRLAASAATRSLPMIGSGAGCGRDASTAAVPSTNPTWATPLGCLTPILSPSRAVPDAASARPSRAVVTRW